MTFGCAHLVDHSLHKLKIWILIPSVHCLAESIKTGLSHRIAPFTNDKLGHFSNKTFNILGTTAGQTL